MIVPVFNFYTQPDKGYVIFDPQSQEENDRLDALLGATPLWQTTIAKRRKEFLPKTGKNGTIMPFTELHPIGWTDTGDIVAVILSGAMAHVGEKVMVSGEWLGVRLRAEAETELKADLQADLEMRKANLCQQLNQSQE